MVRRLEELARPGNDGFIFGGVLPAAMYVEDEFGIPAV